MSLVTDIVDDFIDGKIGDGKVVTRREILNKYKGRYSDGTLAGTLSSSRFTTIVTRGIYKIDPRIIKRRKQERARKPKR